MARHPEQPPSALPLLTEPERHRLLVEWNATRADYPRDRCIHQLFEAQAARTPDAVAVVFEGQELTYQALNRRANQLAHFLRKQGVGPEVLVGIGMERSLEMIVGILGVLKAGSAYVPLDPAYPRDWLSFIVEDTQLSLLLTQERLVGALPARAAGVVCLDSGGEAIARESEANSTSGVTSHNLAYVIYTSGSTGRPKGVMICHRSVCNHLSWRQTYFPLTAADRLLHKTSICFDDSVWELFEPLVAGARLVMARPGGQQDTAYLVQQISEQQITAVTFVPSMLQLFLDEEGVGRCSGLRRVTTGGETLSVELQERFLNCLPVDLHNGYGPTETTIAATFWTCRRGGHEPVVPIGRPIANTQIYVLDSRLQPVPIGVAGALYIGGDGLARGYLRRPELTAERFIPHPFAAEPGERLYRTGDRARYRPDGNLEFLGRGDYQVKLRGFRIELGEIEAALRQHPSVREAVVLDREDQPGEKRLVAYVVPAAQQSLTPSDLRRFLREKLPAQMVPCRFEILEALPRLPNGKVDRRALLPPDPARPEPDASFAAPRTPVETMLAGIWAELLHLERVGIHDSFFALGGHSLLATRVVSRIRQALRVELPLRALFETPTVAGLALTITHRLAEQVEAGEMAELLAELEARSEGTPGTTGP